MKYFGPKHGRKVVGERLIFWVIVPTVANVLVFIYYIVSSLCCSDQTKDDDEVKSKKVDSKPEPSEKKKDVAPTA